MRKTKELIESELIKRIEDVKVYLNSAQMCLDDYDYFQCAVRIEEISNLIKFDHTLMQIFETESKLIKE